MLSGERSISAARHTVAFDRLTDRDEALAYLPLAWVGDHYLNYAQGYVAGFCRIALRPEGAETVKPTTCARSARPITLRRRACSRRC